MGIQDRDYWEEDRYDPKQFRKPHDNWREIQSKQTDPFKIFLAIIAAIVIGGIILWFARIAILGAALNNLQKTTNNAFLNIQTQSLENQAKLQKQLKENLKKQREKEQTIEAERIAKLPPEQREELKRNQQWKQQYSPPTQCVNTANAYMIGECIKYEKKARAQFENSMNGKEEYWNKYYTPPTKCLNPQSSLQELECNNKKNNMRKYFEADWQAKINSGWRPSPLN